MTAKHLLLHLLHWMSSVPNVYYSLYFLKQIFWIGNNPKQEAVVIAALLKKIVRVNYTLKCTYQFYMYIRTILGFLEVLITTPPLYKESVANKREYSLTWKGHLNIRIAPKSHLRNEPEI